MLDKYIRELDCSDGYRLKQRENSVPQIPKVQRALRPDSLSHFPFFDEYGSVPDALHGQTIEKPRILEIGAPKRRELIIKIFEEMRYDKRGIRLSDIPQALEVRYIILSFFKFYFYCQ